MRYISVVISKINPITVEMILEIWKLGELSLCWPALAGKQGLLGTELFD